MYGSWWQQPLSLSAACMQRDKQGMPLMSEVPVCSHGRAAPGDGKRERRDMYGSWGQQLLSLRSCPWHACSETRKA